MPRIESSNLRIFDFDYDLTFMVFFISAEEQVYSRYGGRCGKGPDERQSLPGLRYTMEAVLAEHKSKTPRFAPRTPGEFYITELPPPDGAGFCIHCHHAKEAIHKQLVGSGKWSIETAFRFPLPDNLGIVLDVDQGDIAKEITPDSPAAAAGLKAGDRIESLNGVPIRSFGDATFALDRAPQRGSVKITWHDGDRSHSGKLELAERWRRTDLSWRPSLLKYWASARVYGKNLTTEEKAKLGLEPERLAFRQKDLIRPQAEKAGIRAGDIILGFNDEPLEMSVNDFLRHVRRSYVKGETVVVNLIRGGKRLRLPMRLE